MSQSECEATPSGLLCWADAWRLSVMMTQELGVQQVEHAELRARHEQLQQALRQHEQVTASSECPGCYSFVTRVTPKGRSLCGVDSARPRQPSLQLPKAASSLKIRAPSLQGSPSLARGPSLEAGSESAQAAGTVPLEEEDPQDADAGADDSLEHRQERLHDVVCSRMPGDDAHTCCKALPMPVLNSSFTVLHTKEWGAGLIRVLVTCCEQAVKQDVCISGQCWAACT